MHHWDVFGHIHVEADGIVRGPARRRISAAVQASPCPYDNGGVPRTRTSRRQLPYFIVVRVTAAWEERTPYSPPDSNRDLIDLLRIGPLPIGLGEQLADGGGIEPPHPFGLAVLAGQCITTLPTVRTPGWSRTSNLLFLRQAPLPVGLQGLICKDWVVWGAHRRAALSYNIASAN